MSVTWYLLRVAPDFAEQQSAERLLDLFLIGRDEREELWHAGELTSIHLHPSVVDAVLQACARDGLEAARLPVFGGEGRTVTVVDGGEAVEHTAVTVLGPKHVARAAAVLETAGYGAWIADNPQRMGRIVAEHHAARWDDAWATRVLHDLEDLQDFYRAAADRGDAVVKYLDG